MDEPNLVCSDSGDRSGASCGCGPGDVGRDDGGEDTEVLGADVLIDVGVVEIQGCAGKGDGSI